jgi:hypothetical protein
MIRKNTAVKVTIATVLALGVVSCMVAQQAGTNSQGGTGQQASSPAPARPVSSAIHQTLKSQNRGPEPDPNLPNRNMPDAPIYWSLRDNSPDVNFKNGPGTYLGFNEKGSWIENDINGKVYVWNLTTNTLVLGANNEKDVPLDLRNPSAYMKNMIANVTGHGSRGTTVATNDDPSIQSAGDAAGTPPPPVPMGASRQMQGNGASITGGVLTFTVNDPNSPANGKQLKFKVMRGAMMMNPNAQANANGIAGQWIGDDPNDKSAVLLFFVQGNGAVAMQAFTGPTAVAMKRMVTMAPAR